MSAIDDLMNFLIPSAYADAGSIQSKGVAYNESRGASPQKLRTPGPDGELGKYQITPPAWKDLQRVYPQYRKMDRFSTLTNDAKAETALRDYLKIIEGYAKSWKIEPTDANLLQMYNVGPGKFKGGTRNPDYVSSYKRGVGDPSGWLEQLMSMATNWGLK